MTARAWLRLSERRSTAARTREILGWGLSLRCRAKEAIAVIERAVALERA